MGRYATFEQVRLQLQGKVRFSDGDGDDDDENRMSRRLANALILEAESELELDLSERYAAPFQTDSGSSFTQLPQTTQGILRMMAEIISIMRILETDFGRGTAMDGEKYRESIEKRYNALKDKLLAKKKETDYRNWRYPPLPGLMLNYHNVLGDDGFSGQILSTSENNGDFPGHRINDPSENFWNAELRDEFGRHPNRQGGYDDQ